MAAINPFLTGEFGGLSKDQLGYLLAAAGLGGAVGSLAFGPLVDRIGRRGPMVWGLLMFSIISIVHCFANSYVQLLVLRALAGAAVGVAYSSASAAVADLVPYERRSTAMGMFSFGMLLALPLGLPVANAFARADLWQGVFALQGAVGVLAMVLVLLLLPRDLGRSGHGVKHLQVLAQPMVVPALFAVMVYVGAFFTTIQLIGVWLHEGGVLPRENQAGLWVGLGLGSALGSLLLAPLGDRLGKRNFVLITTMAMAATLLLLDRVNSTATLIAVGIPMALISAARTGPLQALMSEIVPGSMRGTLMGLRSAAMQLGIGVFGVTGGWLYKDSGFSAVLYMAAGAVIVSYFLIRIFLGRMR
jgi:predicted MFS family arabinose efflux permease